MAHLLGAEALHLEYPTKVVFDSITLGIEEGDRIGIVGRNGDAKSSLLAMLADLDWDTPVGGLSGGQRRRIALAALLVKEWDIIALDEPTNHLDVEAITWLAGHLKKRWAANAGAFLVVTHDRMAAASEAKRQNLASKELAWLRRGAPARTAKPKFRIEAANQLIADVPEIGDKISLQSLAASRLGKDVVDLLDAGVSYGILGVNAAGKSTLLGLVAGTIEPTTGTVKRGKTVPVRTLTQRIDEIEQYWNDPVRKVIEGLRTEYTFGTGSKAQALMPGQLLERFGFSSAQLSTPVKDLSGGQQRRLQLVLLDQPNVLILDGPNNQEPSIEKLTTLSHRRSRSSGSWCHVRRRGCTPHFSLRARAVVR